MTTLPTQPRTVVAAACRTPWGPAAAGLPGGSPTELPNVTGFVLSHFSPLVAQVATACLGTPDSGQNLIGELGDRTAIVLATAFGDTTTGDTATQRLVAGQVHSPLLFFQSVTTSILGHLAKQYGITGPITCISAGEELATEALRLADILLDDEGLEQVLLVGIEIAANERAAWVQGHTGAAEGLGALPGGDAAAALLLRRGPQNGAADLSTLAATEPWGPAFGWLAPLVGICVAVSGSTTSD